MNMIEAVAAAIAAELAKAGVIAVNVDPARAAIRAMRDYPIDLVPGDVRADLADADYYEPAKAAVGYFQDLIDAALSEPQPVPGTYEKMKR